MKMQFKLLRCSKPAAAALITSAGSVSLLTLTTVIFFEAPCPLDISHWPCFCCQPRSQATHIARDQEERAEKIQLHKSIN